ncbi:MAG: hypothetical protein ACT4O0_18385 [Pseudonocardia sp.]|jgi:carboxymethylenebutenolidase
MTVGIQQLMRSMEQLRDGYRRALYTARDLDAALASTTDGYTMRHLPAGTGTGPGRTARRYLAEDVLPHLPADLAIRQVSRTVDPRRLVDEVTVEFTHDRELPWLLPAHPPTHRRARVLAVSVVDFRHTTHLGRVESLIAAERTLWDHSGLLAQLGLEPGAARAG